MVSVVISKQFFRDSTVWPSLLKAAVSECSARCMSGTTAPKPAATAKNQSDSSNNERKTIIPERCRFKYPEFLPAPNLLWRNPVREKLERQDMLARRANIDIPEFYVGSVLAVYSSTKHSPEKKNKFVGICVQRCETGLRSWFELRNVIDHIGVQIKFDIYDPRLEKIEVLRLERRLDEHLLYLKDAPPEYSTFPLDMEPEFHPEGEPVPVNEIKVQLKPRPWTQRWELKGLKGLADLGLPQRFYDHANKIAQPWEEFDLMKQYRATIPEEEQKEIYAEVYSELHQQDISRKKRRRKQDGNKGK